ncbi:MAG: hypothetical protein NT094_00675, partial [Candidatus Staskawiczbacteria bacterium]|nr:hypothetical protein [Candidatus Staskawiczbacteria bacterium]
MVAEQQLIDYVKKAREAGQTDDQTRDLLYKNGWTSVEIDEAITALNPTSAAQPQVAPAQPFQPEPQSQPAAIQLEPAAVQQSDLSSNISQPVETPEVAAISQPQPQIQPEITIQDQPEIVAVQSEPVVVQSEPAQEPPVQQPEPIQAQPQPQEIQPKYSPSMARVGHRFSFLKFLVVFVIIIVLVIAGYMAAGQFFNLPYSNVSSILGLFMQDPKTVINKMVINMKDVKSSQSNIRAEIDFTQNGKNNGAFIFTTTSAFDKTDPKNIKANGNFTIKITDPGATTPSTTATVSVVTIGNTYYLKVNDITVPASSTTADYAQFMALKGKWLLIDQNSMKALSQNGGTSTPIDISQLSQTQANFSDLENKIGDILVSEDMYKKTKKVGEEL